MRPLLIIAALFAAAPVSIAQAKLDSPWAGRVFDAWMADCAKGRVTYLAGQGRVEREFFKRMRKVGTAEILAAERREKKAAPNLFLELARDVWPQFLPANYPGRLAYVDCAASLRRLNQALAAGAASGEGLAQWRNCLADNYRDGVPALTARLQACLTNIAE